jgi:hypothetical protein
MFLKFSYFNKIAVKAINVDIAQLNTNAMNIGLLFAFIATIEVTKFRYMNPAIIMSESPLASLLSIKCINCIPKNIGFSMNE